MTSRLSNSKTPTGDRPGVEVSEEAVVVVAHLEASTVFRAPQARPKKEAHKEHPKEEVMQGEERSKRTPFAFTATKNFTSRRSVDLE